MSTGLTREQVAAAFPGDDITTASAEDLPDGLTDPVARRVLTEIGFPESVVGCLFFEGVEEPMQTLAEFRDGEPTPAELAGDYLVAVTDTASVCLNGSTGECRFAPTGSDTSAHAAADLELLLTFLCRLRTALFDVAADTPDDELDQVEERLVAHYRAADPAIAEAGWRWIIRRCIGEVRL